MTQLIQPLFEKKEEDCFKSTKHRFFTMFTPIQRTKYKNSDLLSYFANPAIDAFLAPMFTIEASIHLLNLVASLVKAVYLWSIYQQRTNLLIDPETDRELNAAFSYSLHCGSALVAQTVNGIFSMISLFTRPVASLHACCLDDDTTDLGVSASHC